MSHTDPKHRFDSFNIYKASYKTVNGHPIAANVLVPKSIKPGKHPLVVKFHGGGLVAGEALFPDWFAGYFVTFLLRNNAILVLPNHRLLPEANGAGILSDLSDFWTWTQSSLPSFLKSKSDVDVEVDLSRILVSGESAGGYMAIESVLVPNPLVGGIKALHLQFPMTMVSRKLPSETVFGMPIAAPDLVEEHLKNIKPGDVVTSSVPPDRLPLAFAMVKDAPLTKWLGEDIRYRPIDAIESVKEFPSSWTIQGKDDEAVIAEDNVEFTDKLKKLFPNTKTRFSLEPGNHGFDGALEEDKVEWLREGLKFLEDEWLN